MNNTEETFFDHYYLIEKFKQLVLQPILPNARFESSRMIGSPDIPCNSFKGELAPNDFYKDSVYEYKGNWQFLHFTSLLALKSILENGFLRMSSFSNLIDSTEIHYAASFFEKTKTHKIIHEDVENQKDNIFCLSLCESDEKNKVDDFMWHVYGDKGNGVLLELTFTEPNPSRFIFGKVLYGDKNLGILDKLKKGLEDFEIKYPIFSPSNVTQMFMEIFSFHKSKRYEIENEVRMLLKVEKQKHEEHAFKSIYQDINARNEIRYFNKLFLKGRHTIYQENGNSSKFGISIFDQFPQIEIKNIILGYELSIEKKVDLKNFFLKIKEKYQYEYKISHINSEGRISEM